MQMEQEEAHKDIIIPSREGQYFGMEPAIIVGDVCSMVEEYVNDGIESIEQHLEVNLKGQVALSKIQDSCEKLRTKLKDVCDTNFDKFEMYMLRNIFSIPESVDITAITDNIKSETKSFTDEERKLDEEIAATEREIRRLTQENALLQSRINGTKTQLSQSKKITQNFEFLQNAKCLDQGEIDRVLKLHALLKPSIGKGETLAQEMVREQNPAATSPTAESWTSTRKQISLDDLRNFHDSVTEMEISHK